MPDPSNPLALLLAAVIFMGGVVGYLWREDRKTRSEQYSEMRSDRDFWRKRTDDLMGTQVQTLTVVRESVEVTRQTVEKLGTTVEKLVVALQQRGS